MTKHITAQLGDSMCLTAVPTPWAHVGSSKSSRQKGADKAPARPNHVRKESKLPLPSLDRVEIRFEPRLVRFTSQAGHSRKATDRNPSARNTSFAAFPCQVSFVLTLCGGCLRARWKKEGQKRSNRPNNRQQTLALGLLSLLVKVDLRRSKELDTTQSAWVLACLDSDDQCVLHSWSPMTRSFPDLMRTRRHEPFPKSLLATSKVYVYIYIYIYIYVNTVYVQLRFSRTNNFVLFTKFQSAMSTLYYQHPAPAHECPRF